ncbi:DUF2092 domain-containing protein [Aliiruegeria sabulilitoris]|uniref:DUF2092 domain-containing protein n=1 Tax=Aliiruegeria sabulilitoris TaxID=1510458 RepID=UPI0008365B4E|nr:DUF2092 domain-containing protein [Aliiruegeria sabulilitoris]NDR57931.1 DUF2092 domain-containing protein [Pseudoruegeria sp. M32A2M]
MTPRNLAFSTTAVAAALWGAQVQADESHARALFAAMSEYMAQQTAFSFDYDSTLDIVTTEGQKLAIASSGNVSLQRPDKLYATRNGGFASIEAGFDGKTLTLFDSGANVLARVELAGTVETLIDELRDTYRRPMPAADLLLADVEGTLGPLFIDVKDLGSGIIRNQECDHLAFRTEWADLQVWIAQSDAPFPCRYTVTSIQTDGAPDYTVDVYNWKVGSEAVSVAQIAAPDGATVVAPGDVPDLDELSGNYVVEGK